METAQPPKKLYHYTDSNAFFSIVREGQLWASDCRLMNDTREIAYGLNVIRQVLHKLEKENDQRFGSFARCAFQLIGDANSGDMPIQELVVSCSFSEAGNLLSQWRAYAPNSGYSIGIDSHSLQNATQSAGLKFGKVIYNPAEQEAFVKEKIIRLLKRFNDENPLSFTDFSKGEWARFDEVLDVFHETAALLKHDGFQEEREWRIFGCPQNENVSFRPTGRGLIAYSKVLLGEHKSNANEWLSEVYVGPCSNPKAASHVANLLVKQIGFEKARVHSCSIPYRL